jgi:hypothetical protein
MSDSPIIEDRSRFKSDIPIIFLKSDSYKNVGILSGGSDISNLYSLFFLPPD